MYTVKVNWIFVFKYKKWLLGFTLVLPSCSTPSLLVLALLTPSVVLNYYIHALPPANTNHHFVCSFFSLSYAVIAFGCASCPKITCGREGCGTEFCYHCKQLWHPNQTCDTARQQRAQTFRLRSFRSSSLSYSQESGAAGTINIYLQLNAHTSAPYT